MVDNTFSMKKTAAITLLVRLENADIPFPQTKFCRIQMIEYISNLLLNDDEYYDKDHIVIEYDKLKLEDEDLKSAINIIKSFS